MPGDESSWDYARALSELWDRSSYERGLISDPFGDTTRAELGLRRMGLLLGELSHPELAVPSVHIAGSKGKGSTANFIASAARAAGHRVGLYTSPHLHRFPERIAIDGQPVSDEDFAELARTVALAARRVEADSSDAGTVTTFEMVTAMAFVAFARAGCRLNVIEVGLGGRYDATNVLKPLVTVITRLDLEHTATLGSTLTEIAWQKAGIARAGVPCVVSSQRPEAEAALSTDLTAIGAPLLLSGRDWTWHGSWRRFSADGPWGHWDDLAIDVPGPHQVENATTAMAALHVVNRSGIAIPEPAVRVGLAQAGWPGRFERRLVKGRTVVMDGAHTPAAAKALVETWQAEYGAQRATVVLGMGADKDARAFIAALAPIVATVIATRADSPRAADPLEIAKASLAIGLPVETTPTVADAVSRACAIGPDSILVTGSLFVAGEAREALGLASPDLAWAKLNQERISRTNAGKTASSSGESGRKLPPIQ